MRPAAKQKVTRIAQRGVECATQQVNVEFGASFSPQEFCMSMYRLSFSVLLVIATALPACIIGERGSGVYAEQQRDVQTFSRVELPGGGIDRVEIVVCDCTAIRVSGDDNLIDLVTTKVSGETLTIDTLDPVWTKEPLVVEVRTPMLELVRASGSTNVSIIDLRGGDLTVDTSGSGDS